MRGDSVSIEVSVNTADLIRILQTNREKHIALYEEAYAGWRQAALDELAEVMNDITGSDHQNTYGAVSKVLGYRTPSIHLKNGSVPQSQREHYDTAIQMLQMHTEETVSIDTVNYTKLVNDDWEWKSEWMARNSGYTSLGAR